MVEQTTINGVDVGALGEAVQQIEGDPKIAALTFRARNRWVNGGYSQTCIQDFGGPGDEETHRPQPFVLDADEPPFLLGEDRGPNAVEALLHALAACGTTSIVYHAAAQGIQLDEVEIAVEGDIDIRGFLGLSEDVRNGFQGIRITYRVKADDVPKAQLEGLLRHAQERAPVFDMVSNQVPITVEVAEGEVSDDQAAG